MIVDPLPRRRALLTIHGFAGQPDAWDEVVEGLDAAPARVRLPGHGRDPELVDGAFDDVVDALAAELARSPPCDIAGYSMGARIALGLVLRHPHRIRRALLIGLNPGLDDEGDRARRRAWDDAWASRIEREGLARFAEAWAEMPLFATQATLLERVRAKQQRDRRDHTTEGLAWAMRELGLGRMPPRWAALTALERPVALLVGERDGKYVELARRMAAASPRIAVTVAPDAGHNVLLESPGRCREALRDLSR